MSSSGQPEEPVGEILSHGRGCGQHAASGRGATEGMNALRRWRQQGLSARGGGAHPHGMDLGDTEAGHPGLPQPLSEEARGHLMEE